MSEKETGGPAFPLEYFDVQLSQKRVMIGMTLRDYFAAKALQAYIGRPNLPVSVSDDELAAACYDMADAMLKTRQK